MMDDAEGRGGAEGDNLSMIAIRWGADEPLSTIPRH
jgi:hypothetical protein